MSTKSKALYTSAISLPVIGMGIYYSLPGQAAALDAEAQTEEMDEKNISTPIPQQIIPGTVIEEGETIAQTPKPSLPLPQPRAVSKNTNIPNIKFSDGDDWFNKPLVETAPETKNYPDWMIKEVEEEKINDPVLYRYHYNNTFKKEVGLEEAKGKLDVLMDHTFMLTYSVGCHLGTAWIMDYVLPDTSKGETYPTRFFMASDGHVVSAINFDKDNPYKQLLPNPDKDQSNVWLESDCFRYYKMNNALTLVKERINHQDSDFNKANWGASQKEHTDKELWVPDAKYNVFKQKNNPDADESRWQFRTHSPKLIYFPHNYIGKEKWVQGEYQEHYTDFAIFEVNFRNETVAKLFTRDFYGKYDSVIGRHRDKALNFFAKPLHQKYTSQELLEKDPKVWIAGYPASGMHHKASTNYNLERKSASRFTYYRSIRGEDGRLLLGSSTAGGRYKWAEKTTPSVSYSYVFDNPEVTFGASGSLVATDDGDVLGTYAFMSHKSEGKRKGGAVALRNMEIKDQTGKVIYPAYDFLEGAPGQNGSYKEQIQKYFLKNGQQTNFSRLRGWTA